MAEELVDALLIEARFDAAGLDASARVMLDNVRRFAREAQQALSSGPARAQLDFDTSGIRSSLAAAEGSVADFFSGFQQGAAEAMAELEAEISRVGPAVQQLSTLPAPQLNTQPAVAAAQTLIDRLGIATREAQSTRQVLSQPIGIPITGAQELRLLSGQLQSLRSVTIAEGEAARRMAQAFNEAGAAAQRASAGTRAWEQGMTALRAQQQGLSSALGQTTRGADRVRGGLVAIAVQATGTTPAIGSLVSGLLLMGPGSAVVAGVAAGIGLLALGFNRLTQTAREAREAQEEFNRTMDRAAAQRNPFTGLEAGAQGLRTQLTEIGTQLEFLRSPQGRIQFQADARSGLVTAREVDNTARIALLEERRAQTLVQMQETARQLSEHFALTPEARRLAEAAEQEARGRERAAAAALRQREEMTKMLLEAQRLIRIQAAGGGNLTQAAGGILPPGPLEVPLILRPALSREQFGTGVGDEIQAELERARQAGQALLVVLDGVDLSLRDIGNADITGPRAAAAALVDTITDLNQGLDSVVGAAVNVGLIGDEAARAIGQVQDLADAIGQVALSASTGNILGLVGSGINLLGGIFGPSQTDREHQRIQEENTRALLDLQDEISGLTTSLGALDRAERATAGISKQDLEAARSIQFFDPQIGIDFLNQKLGGFGISLEELDRQAEAMGLDIIADNGRLVVGAFEALNAVLGLTIDQLTTFDENSFTEQRLLQEWQSRFAGIDQTAEEQFRQTIEALRTIPTLIDERFAGVDLANEEAVRAVFQQLLADFEAGRITAEEFDQLSREGLFDLFRQGADYLDSFNEGLQKATSAALNVPTGFRIALARFEASDPSPIPPPGFDPRSRPRFDTALPPTGTLPALTREDVAILRADATSRQRRTDQTPRIVNLQGATFEFHLPNTVQDGAALYREFRRRVEDEALSTTGDVADRGGVL